MLYYTLSLRYIFINNGGRVKNLVLKIGFQIYTKLSESSQFLPINLIQNEILSRKCYTRNKKFVFKP